MGELNMDKIDRALLEEYKRRYDEYYLQEVAKATEDLQPGRKVLAHGLQGSLFHDNNFAGIHRH